MIDRRRVARTILQDERILRAARLGHGRTVVVAILADAGIAAGPGPDDRSTVEITRLFVDRDMIVAILVVRRDAVVARLIDGGREIPGRRTILARDHAAAVTAPSLIDDRISVFGPLSEIG